MDYCCENCGWSEIVGSPIMCNYSGHRTWRDECCEAWKPKEKETNMVEVVRCKECKHKGDSLYCPVALIADLLKDTRVFTYKVTDEWFCADGERK